MLIIAYVCIRLTKLKMRVPEEKLAPLAGLEPATHELAIHLAQFWPEYALGWTMPLRGVVNQTINLKCQVLELEFP